MHSLGLVGVNTSHADAFSRIFNGDAETSAIIDNARITHIWGDDPERVQSLATTHDIATTVDEPATMIGHIDGALIIDDTGGGASHVELARPFIEAGVPLFIDKPMTTDYADAVALFDLAGQHSTPIMSCSALRFPVELDRDALDKKDIAIIEYDTDLVAVVETLRDAGYLFHCTVFGDKGHTSFDVNDAMGFYSNEMREFVKMIETKQSPLTREQTLDVMAILHAGNRSAELGRRVLISEITGA